MTDLAQLKLFATRPHQCSYLPQEEATTVFVDPDAEMNGAVFSQLSEFGFRRSGPHVYRPRCQSCHACIPIRIPVASFVASRSQKRCLRNNRDLTIEFVDAIDDDEHYLLYRRYIERRHADGDMYPPSINQYLDFLTSEWGITRYAEFRVGERLILVSVIDELESGASAIYAFFDPDEAKRSLGVFNVLSLIQWAREQGLPFVYLGYWIKNCQKMNYKVDYRPFQLLIDNCWVTVKDFNSDLNP